jgi:dTDP-4-amino-4,6-dideoxygalactose transaminase
MFYIKQNGPYKTEKPLLLFRPDPRSTMNRTHLPERRSLPAPRLGSGLIGQEEETLVLQALREQNLFRYYGKDREHPPLMAATLEEEFRQLMGSRFALAVTSGTAALEVALGALGVGPGDEVIVPAWSWISCFTSVVRVGARPVLAEIDETLCLAPGEITRLCTERTRAVMVIHYQGVAADLDPILAEAEAAGIAVLEDCAESPGVTYKGRRIGTIGRIGIFSFQHNKAITAGEGGMVVTDDPVLYERAVRMHDLGQFRPYHQSVLAPVIPAFCGSQFRMSELTAAVALAQVRKLPKILAHCRRISQTIQDTLETLPGFERRKIPDAAGDFKFENYFLLPTPELAAAVKQMLADFGISSQQMTGTYCHYRREYCQTGQAHSSKASPFSDFAEWPAQGYRVEDFPRTESIIHRFVAIPVGVTYSEEDASYIAAALRGIHDQLLTAKNA